jgi:hypothetical protein
MTRQLCESCNQAAVVKLTLIKGGNSNSIIEEFKKVATSRKLKQINNRAKNNRLVKIKYFYKEQQDV